jgi:hypothetical protein
MLQAHLSIETLLDLVADSTLDRPAHLSTCRECQAEYERLEVATGPAQEEAPPPLRWLDGLAAPQTTAFLGDFGRLLFGRAVGFAPSGGDHLGALHPWFRDFLGEEPANRLAQKIVEEKLSIRR